MDDYSRATWVFLFAHKSQVPTLLNKFFAYVQNQFKTSPKTLRSDNGTEFTNTDITFFFFSC